MTFQELQEGKYYRMPDREVYQAVRLSEDRWELISVVDRIIKSDDPRLWRTNGVLPSDALTEVVPSGADYGVDEYLYWMPASWSLKRDEVAA